MDKKLFYDTEKNIDRDQLDAFARKLDARPDLIKWSGSPVYGTLLHKTVFEGKLDAAKLLLERGADPNAVDDQRMRTPLHFAAVALSRQAIDMLLDAGADINRVDFQGNQPIRSLFEQADRTEDAPAECERLFYHMLERGAVIVNFPSVLCAVITHGMNGLLERLLRDRPPIASPDGDVPASSEGTLELSELLPFASAISAASAKALDSFAAMMGFGDDSPLRVAVYVDNLEALAILIRYGFASENDGKDGREALIIAVRDDNPEAARMLCEAGVSTAPEQYFAPSELPGIPASVTELAGLLYSRAGEEVLRNRKQNPSLPGDKTVIAALVDELERFPAEVRPLALVKAKNFVAFVMNKLARGEIAVPANEVPFDKVTIWDAQFSNEESGEFGEPAWGEESACAPETVDGYIDEQEAPEFGELSEMQDMYVRDMQDNGTLAVTVDKPLAEVLEELDSLMARLDPRIPRMFNPGRPRGEIEQLWRDAYKMPLPEELAVLYAWHDGMASPAFDLFEEYAMLPFENALSDMRWIAMLYPGYQFNFMRNVWGDWYQYDLRSEWSGTVCQVYHDGLDDGDVYPGLAALFGALATCFREGLFTVSSRGDGDERLVGERAKVHAVFAQHRFMQAGEDLFSEEPFSDEDESPEDMYYEIPLPQ